MTDENNGTKDENEAAISAAAVSKAEPKDPIPSKPATEADLGEVEKRLSGFERSTIRWTRASFVVVLATAVFICLQWLEMRSGGTDTHELAVQAKNQADRMQDFANRMKDQSDRTKDLADRMKDLADQTKEIARISRNELVDVQRAFISVTSLDPKVIPNGAYTWTLTVENSGSTNAQHLEMRRNCGTPGSLGIKWPDFLDFSKHLLAPQFLEIGPHSTQTLGFCAAIPSLVDGPDRPWIMFGEFTYADIFGEDHLTEFCYQSFGYGSMVPCEGINSRHNCTDQDCKEFKRTTASLKNRPVKKPN